MSAKWLDPDGCAGCGQCLENCAQGCFIPVEHYQVKFDPTECVGCGACVDVCPNGLLILED